MGADLPLIVLWLICAATFFTFYLGFINLRGFKHALQIVRGSFSELVILEPLRLRFLSAALALSFGLFLRDFWA